MAPLTRTEASTAWQFAAAVSAALVVIGLLTVAVATQCSPGVTGLDTTKGIP